MSIIDELRRRNVFKAAIAYVAAGWLLLQVADVVVGNLDLPGWVFLAVLIAVVIGLPAALILAWLFEITPQGIRKQADANDTGSGIAARRSHTNLVVAATLILAIGFFVAGRLSTESGSGENRDTAPTPATENDPQETIAVMAFVNLSSDPEQEYFADGLSEEILNMLSRVPGLRVIGRSSAFSFKGRNEDARTIGRELGVNRILEGTVRRSGDQLRVTTQLVDTESGEAVWSESYPRAMTDVFAVQDSIAEEIIAALQLESGILPSRGEPTNNYEAYTLFLKARILLDAQQGAGALPLLQRAVELDTEFAEAFELLAYGYWQQADSSISMSEAQQLCHQAATRALAVNPQLAFASALRAITSSDPDDSAGSIELLIRAHRDEPGDSARLRTLIYELTFRGYIREAHLLAMQFVRQDPLSPVANYNFGESLIALDRIDEAIDYLRISLELDNAFARWQLPAAHLAREDFGSARRIYVDQLEQAGVRDTDWVSDLMSGARDPLNGRAFLDRRIPEILDALPDTEAAEWEFNFRTWYLLFGHLDRYYELIEQFEPQSNHWSEAYVMTWLGTVFQQSGFTANEAYVSVARKLGTVAIWERRGPPDYCTRSASDWICQ